jgi:Uma2 family endonuclease
MPQHIFSKVGMPQPTWRHQRIMRNIIVNYYKLPKSKRPLELIPAAEIGEVSNGLAPDILFIDKSGNSIVFIEIDHTKNLSPRQRYLRAEILFDRAETLQEVLFYNYKTGEWDKYVSDKEKKGDLPYYSSVLDADCNTLIKNPN